MMTQGTNHFEYAGRDLEAMGFAKNYHAWIRDEFADVVRGDVAEVGAGDGEFSKLLLDLKPRSLTLFEPSAAMHVRQSRRLREVPWISRINSTFSDCSEHYANAFDCMLYVNVLEHILADEDELSLAYEALRPGGSLCIFVPALPWLMSEFDRGIGHHRRYARHDLRHKLRGAGFSIQRDHYLDGMGIVPWLVFMTLGRRRLGAGATSAYDRHVVPALRIFETRVRPTIGKNLLVIARREFAPGYAQPCV